MSASAGSSDHVAVLKDGGIPARKSHRPRTTHSASPVDSDVPSAGSRTKGSAIMNTDLMKVVNMQHDVSPVPALSAGSGRKSILSRPSSSGNRLSEQVLLDRKGPKGRHRVALPKQPTSSRRSSRTSDLAFTREPSYEKGGRLRETSRHDSRERTSRVSPRPSKNGADGSEEGVGKDAAPTVAAGKEPKLVQDLVQTINGHEGKVCHTVTGQTNSGGETSDTDNSNDEDEFVEPEIIVRRRGGVSAEAAGAFNKRFARWRPCTFEKTKEQTDKIIEGLRHFPLLSKLHVDVIKVLARITKLKKFDDGQIIVRQGEVGSSGYVLIQGSVDVYFERGVKVNDKAHGQAKYFRRKRHGDTKPEKRGKYWRTLPSGRLFGEISMLFGLRRTANVYANGRCELAKLSRDTFFNLVSCYEMEKRSGREMLLRKAKIFETLDDEAIAKLAEVMHRRQYKSGSTIIKQNDGGDEFFIILEGKCIASVARGVDATGDWQQEHQCYGPGDTFGERGFIFGAKRGATVTALTQATVLSIKRANFERMFGDFRQLRAELYLQDPRRTISEFYMRGDQRGPRGACVPKGTVGEIPDRVGEETEWFVVYRPTSRDAIAKMLAKKAVGKGLNVKGKSARKDILSGYVPFVQIHNDEHKALVEASPPDTRLIIYYQSEEARMAAKIAMECFLDEENSLELEGTYKLIEVDNYPRIYGLDLHERVMREAYIERTSIEFTTGWETGRDSSPGFMDMNLHSIRANSLPKIVLYQFDIMSPMNPHGLIIAYAEDVVKPVVSDFDTFLIGSRGFHYTEILPRDQQELAKWSLEQTQLILRTPDVEGGWCGRWMDLLAQAQAHGLLPNAEQPFYGFGDYASYKMIETIVASTKETGAIRHGAECFNFLFPQEMDQAYLVVWQDLLADPNNTAIGEEFPWCYLEGRELRKFLMDRIKDGWVFPLNPVWPVRDKEWYPVYEALLNSHDGRDALKCFLPTESGINELIKEIHKEFPNAFASGSSGDKPAPSPVTTGSMFSGEGGDGDDDQEYMDPTEKADQAAFTGSKILSSIRQVPAGLSNIGGFRTNGSPSGLAASMQSPPPQISNLGTEMPSNFGLAKRHMMPTAGQRQINTAWNPLIDRRERVLGEAYAASARPSAHRPS